MPAADGVSNGGRAIGTVVSGDRFVEDPNKLRWLQREFSALATEMEGAAFGYTCDLNGLPFLVIRGLSDTADETASTDLEGNLSTVCKNCFHLLEHLIPQVAGAKESGARVRLAD